MSWAPDDRVLSVSADGTIKQWDSGSGQITRAGPRHPLGLTSLSTSQDGRYALFNSVEGLTQMWDLQSGDIVGKFESYARPSSGQLEPCTWLSIKLALLLIDLERSLVRVFAPKSHNIRLMWWIRKCPRPFHRSRDVWPTSSYPFDWPRQVWALLYLCTSDASVDIASENLDRGFLFGYRVLTATG